MKRYPRLLAVAVLLLGGCASTLPEAAFRGDREEVEDLIAAGADVNARDEEGKTPVFHALGCDQADVIKVLIDHEADVNLPDYSGRTPLHEAARKGRLEFLQILIAAGGDVNARNDTGWTPFDVAVNKKQDRAAELLFSRGGTGYSYAARRYLMMKKGGAGVGEENKVTLPDMRGMLEEDYDDFNERKVLSTTFSVQPFKNDLFADRYRSVLSEYARRPKELYDLARKEWLIGPWHTVSLSSNENTFPAAEMTFIFQSPIFYFFSSDPIRIKIGDAIHQAPFLETKNDVEETTASSQARYRMGKEIGGMIKEARSVVIRVPFDNQPPLNWEVPSPVLKNWKEFFRRGEELFR